MRGYNADEVRAFLQSLSAEWEQVLEDNRRLKSELERTQASLRSYTDMEEIMRKTLYQAEQSSMATMDAARRDAELKLAAAEQQAREIRAEAQLERQREEMRLQDLLEKRATIMGQLRAFLKNELDQLQHHEANLIGRSQPLDLPLSPTAEAIQEVQTTVAPVPTPTPEAPRRPEPLPEVPPKPEAVPSLEPIRMAAPQDPILPEKPTPRPVAQKRQGSSFFDQAIQHSDKSAIIESLSEDL